MPTGRPPRRAPWDRRRLSVLPRLRARQARGHRATRRPRGPRGFSRWAGMRRGQSMGVDQPTPGCGVHPDPARRDRQRVAATGTRRERDPEAPVGEGRRVLNVAAREALHRRGDGQKQSASVAQRPRTVGGDTGTAGDASSVAWKSRTEHDNDERHQRRERGRTHLSLPGRTVDLRVGLASGSARSRRREHGPRFDAPVVPGESLPRWPLPRCRWSSRGATKR
jgi:hypothetical protein